MHDPGDEDPKARRVREAGEALARAKAELASAESALADAESAERRRNGKENATLLECAAATPRSYFGRLV